MDPGSPFGLFLRRMRAAFLGMPFEAVAKLYSDLCADMNAWMLGKVRISIVSHCHQRSTSMRSRLSSGKDIIVRTSCSNVAACCDSITVPSPTQAGRTLSPKPAFTSWCVCVGVLVRAGGRGCR